MRGKENIEEEEFFMTKVNLIQKINYYLNLADEDTVIIIYLFLKRLKESD